MREYIDREVARWIIDSPRSKEQMLIMLASIPTEDVAPIIRGKWEFREITETIEKGVKECKCSVCGFGEDTFNGGLIPFFLKDCKYCPDCGAIMEGGNKNDIS